jgi:hypothetical protein
MKRAGVRASGVLARKHNLRLRFSSPAARDPSSLARLITKAE